MQVLVALFNPKPCILIQKCHPYKGNLNSGDSKNAFPLCGDVLGSGEWRLAADRDLEGPLQKLMPDNACIIHHQLDAQAIQSIIKLCLVLCFDYCATRCAKTSMSVRCL